MHPGHPTVTRRLRRCASAALLATAALPLALHAAPPSDWAVAPYFYFVHAVSVGEVDLALAQFATDAVVVAGPQCAVAAPCRGHAAIRERFLLPRLALGLRPPVHDQRFDGAWMRARGDAMPGSAESAGAGRLSAVYTFELRKGRIATLHVQGPMPVVVADAASGP